MLAKAFAAQGAKDVWCRACFDGNSWSLDQL